MIKDINCNSIQMCMCVLEITSVMPNYQALLSMELSGKDIWVYGHALSSVSYWSKDRICISYVCPYWQEGSLSTTPPGKALTQM